MKIKYAIPIDRIINNWKGYWKENYLNPRFRGRKKLVVKYPYNIPPRIVNCGGLYKWVKFRKWIQDKTTGDILCEYDIEEFLKDCELYPYDYYTFSCRFIFYSLKLYIVTCWIFPPYKIRRYNYLPIKRYYHYCFYYQLK